MAHASTAWGLGWAGGGSRKRFGKRRHGSRRRENCAGVLAAGRASEPEYQFPGIGPLGFNAEKN